MPNISKQRSNYDCVLASLTMAVNGDYDQLWPEDFRAHIEVEKGCYGKDLDRAFELAGLTRNEDYWPFCVVGLLERDWTIRTMLKGRRALLQVPSLNHQKSSHVVYWDGNELHDPSNKQVYQWIDQLAIQWIWIFDERRNGKS